MADWGARDRQFAFTPTSPISQKALKGHEKEVEIHKEKLANPEKAKTREPWESMSREEQERTLNDWREHIQRHKDQADIMRGILRERGLKE